MSRLMIKLQQQLKKQGLKNKRRKRVAKRVRKIMNQMIVVATMGKAIAILLSQKIKKKVSIHGTTLWVISDEKRLGIIYQANNNLNL